ncbi:MAG: hypothetical protein ACRD4B_10980, partial [Acidobacteriota bacterium]
MTDRVVAVGILVMILLIPVAALKPVHAEGVIVTQPSMKNSDGTVLSEVGIGQQVALSTTITNDNDSKQPFTCIFDVRDSNGVTVYLSWLSGTLPPNDRFDIGLSWNPEKRGSYEVRTFVVSDLKN